MLKTNKDFLQRIWSAFEFIGAIDEMPSHSPKRGLTQKNMARLGRQFSKFQIEEDEMDEINDASVDNNTIKGVLRQMFCDEVLSSINSIKLKSLSYMEIIINYFIVENL